MCCLVFTLDLTMEDLESVGVKFLKTMIQTCTREELRMLRQMIDSCDIVQGETADYQQNHHRPPKPMSAWANGPNAQVLMKPLVKPLVKPTTTVSLDSMLSMPLFVPSPEQSLSESLLTKVWANPAPSPLEEEDKTEPPASNCLRVFGIDPATDYETTRMCIRKYIGEGKSTNIYARKGLDTAYVEFKNYADTLRGKKILEQHYPKVQFTTQYDRRKKKE